jgi:hypothetical protein
MTDIPDLPLSNPPLPVFEQMMEKISKEKTFLPLAESVAEDLEVTHAVDVAEGTSQVTGLPPGSDTLLKKGVGEIIQRINNRLEKHEKKRDDPSTKV